MFIYSSTKKRKWALITAVVQFILYLLIFLLGSYLSTLIDPDDESSDNNFVPKYEKYIVLSSSLYMIIPFVLSIYLIFSLMLENVKFLTMWYWLYLATNGLICLLLLGSGIFSAVKGESYIGYTLISVSLTLGLLMGHSMFLVYQIIQNGLYASSNNSEAGDIENDAI